MQTLVIFSAHDDPALARLKELLSTSGRKNEFVSAANENALRTSLQSNPNLIILILSNGYQQVTETLYSIRSRSEARVLVVGPIHDPRVILRTLQEGADLFIDRDELEKEMPGALSRLFPKAETGIVRGRLIGIMSANGGCGASTLASNLAALYARSNGHSGLIDLNPGRGDLPALLDLKPQFTLVDVCLNESRLDRAMLEKMLVQHASGIKLLASPAEFADFRSLTTSGIRHALSLCRTIFPETILDMEDCLHSEQIEALRQIDQLFLICRLDFTSLRNTRRVLEQLNRLEIPKNQIRLVVNQHGQANELEIEEAEQAIGEALTSFIPYDPKSINSSNNLGVPVVLKFPNSKVAQSLSQMANIAAHPRPEKVGLLGKLKIFLGGHSAKAASL